MTKSNEILCGPALDQLKTLDSESVDCCITSPPYWALRDYKSPPQIWNTVNGCAHEWNNETKKWHSDRGDNKHKEVFDRSFAWKGTEHAFCSKCNAWKGSLGLEPTFQLYIKHLVDIFSQVKRVLKKEGSCWVNMGDTYSGSGTRGGQGYEDSKDITERRYYKAPKEIPEKSLCLIPQRFQIAMVDAGWICRNTIIWYKPNCMPSSAKDRFTVDFEYLFFFVKSQKYYFETQYEPCLDPEDDIRRALKTSEYNRKKSYFDEHYHNNKQTEEQVRTQVALGRIKRCVWKIPTQPFSEAHFAVFPPALVKTPLLATCPGYVCKNCGKAREKITEETGNMLQLGHSTSRKAHAVTLNDTSGFVTNLKKERVETGLTECGCNAGFDGGIVLDPFMGSGTVALVAMQNARNFLGIELNQSYIDMALKRLEPYLLQTRLSL